MSVVVALPDEVAALTGAVGGALESEVLEAVVFQQYQRGRLSAGKAAELLHLTRGDFEQRRIEFGIARPFSEEELEHDLAWAKNRK